MAALLNLAIPISDEFLEISPVDGESYQVQYFERAEFEYHPYNLKPYEVLLSQLGTLRWQDNHEAQNPLKPEFRSEVPDGEYLPLYPGAVIKGIYDESVTERLVRYEAPASENRVRAFYAGVLPKYGWTFLDSIELISGVRVDGPQRADALASQFAPTNFKRCCGQQGHRKCNSIILAILTPAKHHSIQMHRTYR